MIHTSQIQYWINLSGPTAMQIKVIFSSYALTYGHKTNPIPTTN